MPNITSNKNFFDNTHNKTYNLIDKTNARINKGELF